VASDEIRVERARERRMGTEEPDPRIQAGALPKCLTTQYLTTQEFLARLLTTQV
jgi:hypothetical protein